MGFSSLPKRPCRPKGRHGGENTWQAEKSIGKSTDKMEVAMGKIMGQCGGKNYHKTTLNGGF